MPASGFCVPGGIVPASPPLHAVAQPPQCIGSVFTSRHVALPSTAHLSCGRSHIALHAPFEHTWPEGHAVVHEPQCIGSFMRSNCGHPLSLPSGMSSSESGFAHAPVAMTAPSAIET